MANGLEKIARARALPPSKERHLGGRSDGRRYRRFMWYIEESVDTEIGRDVYREI